MRKTPFVLVLFLFLELPASAQAQPTAPAFEVYAGYALDRLNMGQLASNRQRHHING